MAEPLYSGHYGWDSRHCPEVSLIQSVLYREVLPYAIQELAQFLCSVHMYTRTHAHKLNTIFAYYNYNNDPDECANMHGKVS